MKTSTTANRTSDQKQATMLIVLSIAFMVIITIASCFANC